MSAYEGMSEGWAASNPQFNLQVYLDMMEDAQPYPSSKNTQVWFQMMQDKMVFPKIRKIFSPDIDKEQIFDYNISNS